ncbi:hypothetical protein Tco_0009646 [Tanacetum coccineum]
MADRRKNLGCVVSDKNLVIYAVNELDSRFATLVEIIRHREPHPTFETAQNMLLLKESSMNDQSGVSTTFESSSSSATILVETNSSDNKVETKISSRLSRWKLKTLSIGGRLTLLKSVLSAIPLYHMSLFNVHTGTLHSLESIRQDFFNGIDRSERKMVIHGAKGGLDTRLSSNINSIWLDIVRDISSLDRKRIDLLSFVRKKVGNGENSLFWIDTWSGEVALKTFFPRLYALELCKYISVADKLRHATLDFSFRRHPRGGAEEEQFCGLSSCLIDVIIP